MGLMKQRFQVVQEIAEDIDNLKTKEEVHYVFWHIVDLIIERYTTTGQKKRVTAAYESASVPRGNDESFSPDLEDL